MSFSRHTSQEEANVMNSFSLLSLLILLGQTPNYVAGSSATPTCVGHKGDQGIPGVAGPPGLRGAVGPQGPPGIPGSKGSQGNTGAEGPEGKPGKQGLQGVIGRTGATGPQGPPGKTGPDGTVGPRGPRGLPGIAGEMGSRGYVGPRGLPGTDGVPGNAGPVGSPGSHGPKGVKGNMGLPGQKGSQGPQGSPGPEMSEDILKRYFSPIKNLTERVQKLEGKVQLGPDPVAAYLYGSSGGNQQISGVVTYWQTSSPSYLLGGITYQNGAITIPINGLYYLYLNAYFQIRSRDTRLTLRVNGNRATETGSYANHSNSQYNSNYVAVILQLRKGDKIDISLGGGEMYTGGPWTYFGAYKLH